ncbi:MAG: S41 family peptidase [Nakamurella sp.]
MTNTLSRPANTDKAKKGASKQKAPTGKKRADAALPSSPSPSATGLLADAPAAVREQVRAAQTLESFLPGAGLLTLADRRRIVEQALVMIEQNYVHLSLKTAMHAVLPVQRLRLLQRQLEHQVAVDEVPEWRFHQEMSSIFHSLRDLHTNYSLPAPFNGKIAFLPFLVEEYYDATGRHYVVSRVVAGFVAPGFVRGAELTSWNGMTVDRAVEQNADRFAGSNDAARHARGVDSLSIRSLKAHLSPAERWVVVGYRGPDGVDRELRQDWLVADNLPPFANLDSVNSVSANYGLDIDADEVGRAKALLFAPDVAGHDLSGSSEPFAAADTDVHTSMPSVFRARSVSTASGTFGHLRIFTFSVNDPDAFVAEFVRLAELLPQNGLILDVRGNGGGHIYASEFTLQTLTPHPIVPEPVQFSATPLNLRMCRLHENVAPGQIDFTPWVRSLDQAIQTGSVFSNAFPITPVDGANSIGQRYHGPVVLITDARCYSATDIFAAGFQDHGIGTVLGTSANTGAGGANVFTHGLLKNLFESPTADSKTPYQALPRGADMRVAIRRTLRVGALAGTPVEDLGIEPDARHDLTKTDVLNGNTELLDHAGAILAASPVRKLAVESTTASSLRLQVAQLDRVDVYIDGRPGPTVDVVDGPVDIAVTLTAGDQLRLEGFSAGELVAARLHTV